jgi:hypothetical protein
MLVARCGDEFVQLLAMMTFRPALALGPLLLALSYTCLILAILTLAWIAGTEDRLGTGLGDVIFALYLGISAPVAAASASRLPLRMPFRLGLVRLFLLYGTAAAGSAVVSLMLGGSVFHVLFAALAGTACAVLLHFAGLLLWARWRRWTFGRRQRQPVPLWGDRTVHDVIGPRLRSAADDVTTTRASGLGPLRLNETPAITVSMEAEAGRLGRWLWHDNGPLLGPVAGYGTARFACVSSLNRAADLDELPAVLRAALKSTLGSMPRPSWRRRRCCCRQTPR